ncbi:MAG TPA: mechanosensitive ion channel family protein [Aequorivita sp.]|jgi:small-conductance mechanosensitive channel|nr:mechanosensitive ion channel protein MscS [Aequorivita sp.]MBP41102.1 mechanosensitive ion channel protein MscS [Aequorivita sp.]HBC04190.1 mechanosensitive ion channel protein MscS [Aequorivita sp.]HNP66807.1 mechanosensitive ion channel family protein [Aequorivita sp.]|tara:strand:- start:30704 stop:31624 length:921 start_codon:yes stop_codon:yes gene_type:complete
MLPLLQSPGDTIQNSLHNYYEEFLKILPRIALGVLVVILGVLLAQLLTNFYKRRFQQKSEDPLMSRFLAQAVKIILIIISIMLALQVAGLDGIATGLLTAVGGGAIILGFAFQDIGKNFLAGIILAFNRPFNINDTIKVDDIFGRVKELSFRYSHIKTFDGRDIYIPNSDVLTKPVENYTADGFFRVDFTVGIGYEDNIEAAKRVIQQVLDKNKEIIRDETHENFVIEDELAASTVNLKVFFWVDTVDYRRASRVLRGLIIKEVKEALANADFNLPSDVVELKLYKNTPEIPFKISGNAEKELPNK